MSYPSPDELDSISRAAAHSARVWSYLHAKLPVSHPLRRHVHRALHAEQNLVEQAHRIASAERERLYRDGKDHSSLPARPERRCGPAQR